MTASRNFEYFLSILIRNIFGVILVIRSAINRDERGILARFNAPEPYTTIYGSLTFHFTFIWVNRFVHKSRLDAHMSNVSYLL